MHPMADETNELLGRLLREVVETRQTLGERIDTVEIKIETFRSEMLGHVDELYRRIDRLETEYQAIRAALGRIEQSIAEDSVRRDALRRQLGELKERIADLELRLAQLEHESGDAHEA